MARPRIIAVIGVDGAGKTTQAKLLAQWLQDEGVGASYFENPGGGLSTDRVARRLGRTDTRALLGSRGRVVVETLIRAVSLARALAWSRMRSQVAVMDRFSYCQYAVVRARGEGGERFARAMLGVFGAPDRVFFLVVPGPVAQGRVEARGYDHEELAHLEAFAAAYRSLPEAPIFEEIDGSGSVEQVQARLRAAVGVSP